MQLFSCSCKYPDDCLSPLRYIISVFSQSFITLLLDKSTLLTAFRRSPFLLQRQLLAKWFRPPQRKQIFPNAGQSCRSRQCFQPHSLHSLSSAVPCWSDLCDSANANRLRELAPRPCSVRLDTTCTAAAVSSAVQPSFPIALTCSLVDSAAWHISSVFFKSQVLLPKQSFFDSTIANSKYQSVA